MKVLQAEFIEAVRMPAKGQGQGEMQSKIQDGGGNGRLHPVVKGPGILIEVDDSDVCTMVPWANVRFAVVVWDEDAPKKR